MAEDEPVTVIVIEHGWLMSRVHRADVDCDIITDVVNKLCGSGFVLYDEYCTCV